MVLAASAVARICAGAVPMEAGLGLDGAVLATVLGQLVVPALIVWPVRGEGVGVAVGGAHAALDDGGHALGQMATNVAHLVLFTPGDDQVVEDRSDRRAERLGAVEGEEGGLGHVEPPLAQPDQGAPDDGGVSVTFDQGRRVLGAVDAHPEGDDAQMLGEMDPGDHDGHSSDDRPPSARPARTR